MNTFLFSTEIFKLYFLRHLLWQQRHPISSFELPLLHKGKGLNDNGLRVLFGMLLIEFINQFKERLADLLAEFYSLLDLLAGRGVVLLVKVEVSVHVELDCFEDLDVIVTAMLDHFIVLYADVDVWQVGLVSVVEVS
jgi:hypothetical protein